MNHPVIQRYKKIIDLDLKDQYHLIDLYLLHVLIFLAFDRLTSILILISANQFRDQFVTTAIAGNIAFVLKHLCHCFILSSCPTPATVRMLSKGVPRLSQDCDIDLDLKIDQD